ncbi:hypothetical protein NEISUBOT_03436 [Neisseria subflava NJ9703]|uniref:Uncharacterized protein n=1 Tax=Neisseria subflava NJ9703 TaxID=546268 RepID=A0A9W5ITI7_NEISU|nr:hypothetical protein NEISUBOT_03436 [Neisseria subflava NJ9703]
MYPPAEPGFHYQKAAEIFIICEYPHFFRRHVALSMSPAV